MKISLSLALGICLFPLAGCGGSGAGPSAPIESAVSGVELLRDDFNGAELDRNQWTIYTENVGLQRTQFGFTPQLLSENGTTFARMRHDTFNPGALGQRFKGTEFFTRNRFARGNGIEIEARVRAPICPPVKCSPFFCSPTATKAQLRPKTIVNPKLISSF